MPTGWPCAAGAARPVMVTLAAEGLGVPPEPVSHLRNTRSAIVGLCTVPIAAAVALYLLRLLIGCARRAPDLVAVAVVNIAFGWIFAGWIVALGMTSRTAPPPPLVQVFQPMPPGTGPPLALAPRPGPQEGTHAT
jgi:Superinfection immunity protein